MTVSDRRHTVPTGKSKEGNWACGLGGIPHWGMDEVMFVDGWKRYNSVIGRGYVVQKFLNEHLKLYLLLTFSYLTICSDVGTVLVQYTLFLPDLSTIHYPPC